jgi:hypothetical protein
MPLVLIDLNATPSKNDIQHYDTQHLRILIRSVAVLNVILLKVAVPFEQRLYNVM